MDEHNGEWTDRKLLEQRIDYLEEVQSSTLEALSLMLSLGGQISQTSINLPVHDILTETRQQVLKLIPFERMVFALLDEKDLDFAICDYWPDGDYDACQLLMDQQVKAGNFAWALRQGGPLILLSEDDASERILIHAMPAKSDIIGMFFGVVPENSPYLKDPYTNLLSIVLMSCAQSIENTGLYNKLQASEERARAMLDANHNPAFLVAFEEGMILDVNSAAADLIEKKISDIEGQLLVDVLPSEILALMKQRSLRVAQSKRPVQFERSLMGRVFDIVIYPVIGPHKNVVQLAIFLKDVTKLRETERHQQELQLELMEQSRLSAVGLLVAGIGHNLRGPLTGLMGHLQLMAMDYPEMTELSMMMKTATTMNDIISTMMIKSRRGQEKEQSTININDLLKTELEFLEGNLYFKHQIEKNIVFQESLPEVVGLYSDFSQGLMNFIHNAIDAMYQSEMKKLTVKTESNKSHIVVTVSDSGCGIAKEHLDKIFEAFFTTKPTRTLEDTNKPRGTGLGLYSTYQLLNPYGVTFDVKSEVGVGTTFIIQIPLSPAEEGMG
ncbi:PAS domain-containing protein [bacterium]|nr:PAS domain-containing protein [bacterium]